MWKHSLLNRIRQVPRLNVAQLWQHESSCRNLSLRIATKARACKFVGQEGSMGVASHAPGSVKECEGMNPHIPKWTPIWELESQRTPESSEGHCRDQKPLDWKFLYIIRNLLKPRCLKWAHMTHLNIWNTSYRQKKGPESNWKFDSRPIKVRNRLYFLACRWRATYYWKDLDKGYNFA
jgi:hypothetical protein